MAGSPARLKKLQIRARGAKAALIMPHNHDPAMLAKAETLVEALPYLQRYAGGHRGLCLRAVVKRFLSDTTAFIARKAQASLWLARKARRAELARYGRMNPRKKKGDIDVSRLISQVSSREDSAESTLDERPERDAVGITGHAADLLAAMRAQLPRNGRPHGLPLGI